MLVGNTLIYMLARVAPGILGLITTALLARTLGPLQYGFYSVFLVAMMLVSNFGFDWLGPSLLRTYELHKAQPGTFATFAYIFLAVMALSAIAATVVWALRGFRISDISVYVLGTVLAWCFSWFELVSKFEIACLRPWRYLRMNLARAILMLVGAGAAAWITHDPIWTAAFTGLAMFAASFGGAPQNELSESHNINRRFAGEILRLGFPVALNMAMLGILNNGTRALIAILNSPRELGIYTAVFVLVQQSLLLVANGIGSAGFPLAVQSLEKGDDELARRNILHSGGLLLFIMAPACLGIGLTGRGLIAIALGPEFYSASVILLPWMAATAFFSIIRSYFFDFAFLFGRRTIAQLQVTIVAALLGIGLSFFLIPKFGSLGAAMAVTASSVVSCIHSAIVGHAIFPMPIPALAAAQILLCCSFMSLIVVLIPGTGILGFSLQVLFGVLAYACSAFVLNVLGLRTRLASYLRF